MNVALVVGIFLLGAGMILMVALLADGSSGLNVRRMRRLRKMATWRDFYEVNESGGIVVGVRLIADTRFGEVLIEQMKTETVNTREPMWASKLRRARLEAWSRADELNSQPPTYTE